MTQELAEDLKEAADGLGVEAEVYANYSGRGMFGAKTYGLVVPSLIELAAIAAEAAADNPRAHELAEQLRGLRWDNMARDFIVY